MSTKMNINDFTCSLNMPQSLVSKKHENDEIAHSLPPYAPQKAYVVDEYTACPSNWMHGSTKASSYFVGIKADHGMWLDFTDNQRHSHDVAVLVSIQGINPITGQRTGKMQLEQYNCKCPVHNVEFAQERFCSKCGYKWPKQNYLATTANQPLWIDGFRAPDGKVRQYIFTEDVTRGVAAQIIGDERVFAIGVAFYKSRSPKITKPLFDNNGLYKLKKLLTTITNAL
ncbi:MAG: hypothetical protein HC836_47070 [Richelia sp. RM2_1_2]|nr:hypothetical protein [Richelia sp. RM2_1_2]